MIIWSTRDHQMKHLSRISTHLENHFSSDAISAFSSVKVNLRLRKPRDILTQKDTKLKLAYRSENHLSQFCECDCNGSGLNCNKWSLPQKLCWKFAENIVSIKIKPLFIFNRRSKFRREENLVRLQQLIFGFQRFQIYVVVGKRLL